MHSRYFIHKEISCPSMGEGQLVGQFMSVCRIFRNNDTWGLIAGFSCLAKNGSMYTIIVQQSPGITSVQGWPKSLPLPQITLVQELFKRERWPRVIFVQQRSTSCGVKNIFWMSLYSKKYTFPAWLMYLWYWYVCCLRCYSRRLRCIIIQCVLF
jgi:hypothetical protein